MGYTKDAARGISWMTLLRGVTRIITFVRLAVLGRLLTPAEFGFFGIASLLLSFLEILTETGINIFLIQHKGHLKEYLDSAWVVSIARGVILGLAIMLLAPFIVSFFHAQEAYPILMLIACVPFIRGFINPAIVTYQKDLLFHKEFGFRSLLFFIDVAVSIVVGFITRSAESFAFGLIASAIVEVILSFVLLPLRPRFSIDLQKVKHVIYRGWWVTVTGIFAYVADNADTITVGRILGSSSLGIYQVAYKFSTLPISEITNVVNQVVFPVYVRFAEDKRRLLVAFLKTTALSSLGALIFGFVIFFLAEPIIRLFMGDQWLAAIPAIQVLAIYGILRTIFGNFAPVFLSVGKQDYVAKMTFFRLLGLGISVIPLVTQYGMIGAGFAMLLSILFEIPIILYFTYKVFHKTPLPTLRSNETQEVH